MKKRLDQILIENNFFDNKNKARGYIIDGNVLVDNQKIIKPGTMLNPNKVVINIIAKDKEYVSRSGKKLEKAIRIWNLNLMNLVCLDIGSSTGGFTDCCLFFKAKYVYAVDVGTNQLDWKLRINPQVKSMEKTNFRYVKKEVFLKKIDFFCCDVSFISVEKILINLKEILDNDIFGIILIKPQFESDREDVKNGKINSKIGHKKSITRVVEYCNKNNFSVININYSPILGNKKKNIEYLCLIKKEEEINNKIDETNIEAIINESWNHFRDLKNE